MSGAGAWVSVVVPSFGHAPYVEAALRSVAAQDGVPLELVVVDDASPDDSVARIERLLADPAFVGRFHGGARLVVHESNLGAYAALNRGLGEARGRTLALLNSDDAYAPGRLRALLAALEASGSQLAFSRVELTGASPGAPTDPVEGFRLRRHQDAIDRFPSVGFACLWGNAALTSGNLCFTRELLEAVGGFEALRYCHDWGFLTRATCFTEPVYVRRPLYRYRLHGGNSFRALGGVAEAETAAVLGRYFADVRAARPANPLAPRPESWPGVFERFMGSQGFWRYW